MQKLLCHRGQRKCFSWPRKAQPFCVLFFGALITGCGTSETPPKPLASTTVSNDAIVAANPADADMPAASPPSVASESTDVASSTAATSTLGDAASPGTTDSPAADVTRTVTLPPAVAPTQEQIAKWTVPAYQPMQLLDCYDGFGDSFVQSMAIAPDGSKFAIGGAKLTIWKMGEAKPLAELTESIKGSFGPPMQAVAISPDGKWLTAGDASIWNVANDQQEALLAPRFVSATGLALSHDRRRLFYCDKDNAAHSRDIEPAPDDVTLPPSSHGAMDADYSQDGKWLAVYADSSIRIIDTATGKLRQVIDGDVKATAGIGWVPKTNLLLVASERNRV